MRDCVKRGICKVNFATELRAAYSKAVKELLAEKPDTIDPKAYGKTAIAAVKELVMARMRSADATARQRNKMAATMKDIARLTGLGLATISSYFNGGNVREKTE